MVQAETQGCMLGAENRGHKRLAWHMQSKEHIGGAATTTPNL